MTLKFIAATLLPLFRRETKFTAADEIFTVVLMVDDLFGSTRVVLHVVKVFYIAYVTIQGDRAAANNL